MICPRQVFRGFAIPGKGVCIPGKGVCIDSFLKQFLIIDKEDIVFGNNERRTSQILHAYIIFLISQLLRHPFLGAHEELEFAPCALLAFKFSLCALLVLAELLAPKFAFCALLEFRLSPCALAFKFSLAAGFGSALWLKSCALAL